MDRYGSLGRDPFAGKEYMERGTWTDGEFMAETKRRKSDLENSIILRIKLELRYWQEFVRRFPENAYGAKIEKELARQLHAAECELNALLGAEIHGCNSNSAQEVRSEPVGENRG